MRCRKPGYSRLYVANPWSQIGCTSLCSKVKYSRFGTRGLLRKGETARFLTPQLDHIGQKLRKEKDKIKYYKMSQDQQLQRMIAQTQAQQQIQVSK